MFNNHYPELLTAELEAAERVGVRSARLWEPGAERIMETGAIHWALMPNGELRVAPQNCQGQAIAPTTVTGGASVQAIGRASVVGARRSYAVLEFDNVCPHYRPSGESLHAAIAAFAQVGLRVPEHAIHRQLYLSADA